MARMPVAQRREQLVAAAIAVMTRDGVRAATTRAIVAEADTSLSVFHYSFGSKQELMEAVVSELVARSVRVAAPGGESDAPESSTDLGTQPGSPTAATDSAGLLRASLHAYFDHVRTHPEVHQLTYEVTQFCLRNDDLASVPGSQYRMYGQVIGEQLDAVGISTPWPTDVLARYLAIMIDGLTLDWLVRRDDEAALAVIDVVVSTVDSLRA